MAMSVKSSGECWDEGVGNSSETSEDVFLFSRFLGRVLASVQQKVLMRVRVKCLAEVLRWT